MGRPSRLDKVLDNNDIDSLDFKKVYGKLYVECLRALGKVLSKVNPNKSLDTLKALTDHAKNLRDVLDWLEPRAKSPSGKTDIRAVMEEVKTVKELLRAVENPPIPPERTETGQGEEINEKTGKDTNSGKDGL